jgi:Domain of unknown function (DUF1707)
MCHSRHHQHRHDHRRVELREQAERGAARPAAPEIVPEPVHLRASDAERERVAEVLRTHAGEGRLTPDELEERLDRVYAAQTRADLRPLLADLPPAGPAPRTPPRRAAAPGQREWGVFLAVSLLMLVIWAAAGFGAFWPVWPIGFWGVSLLAKRGHGRRAAGPAPV